MARRFERLTLDTLADLPARVRTSLLWELEPVRRERVLAEGGAEAAKESWLSQVLLEWGSCGRVAYVDDEVAGFVQYAPPGYFAGTASFPTSPLGEDCVQLATVLVLSEHETHGLGRVLLQQMVKDLLKRGDVRAVEAIALQGSPKVAELLGPTEPCGPLPVEFLQRVGFKTQRPHPRHPRMRLDLRSVLTWKDEVGVAWGRLRDVVRPSRAPSPVSRSSPQSVRSR